MSFAVTAGVGAAASAASAGIQASSGKKAADAAAGGQLEGLGQANKTIRDAISQYDPYRRGGDQAYRRMQRLYGFQPAGGDPDAPPALTKKQKQRFAKLQGRTDLTPAETRELSQINAARDRRRAYGQDFDLASTVGKDEEKALLGLEEGFGKEEQDIYGRQEKALADYTARNAGLDSRYAEDVGALDKGFKEQTGTLDDQYYGEERALRDKIAKGDVTLDPGYKFRVEQGQLVRERGAAAKGGLLSGGHLKDLEEYSQGMASQEFGAATGRLYDLYNLGKGNFQQRRGEIVGDYERGRGYKTGDYTMARGYGRADYGDLQTFLGQNLAQRRGRFDRQYGQGMDRRNFAIDRFGRKVGGAQGINQQGFNALGAQTGLAQTLASLYGQEGQVRGAQAAAGPQAWGQFGGSVADDLSFLALLYGQGGLGGGRGRRQTTRYDPYADAAGIGG